MTTPVRAPALNRRRVLVTGVERVGPYTLLRVARGALDPGTPGQFFMVEAPGRLLPRPFSLCVAPPGELAFLIDPVGPGTRGLCAVSRGERLHVLGPLGRGFRLDVARPLLVGGGIGIAPLPYLASALRAPRVLVGFRSASYAEAAELLPRDTEVVVDPILVTAAMPDGYDVLACGPEPMLRAVRARAPAAQLAWEAPMACGFGACFGCVVEIAGDLRRLCLDGPVLRNGGTHGSPVGPLLLDSENPAAARLRAQEEAV